MKGGLGGEGVGGGEGEVGGRVMSMRGRVGGKDEGMGGGAGRGGFVRGGRVVEVLLEKGGGWTGAKRGKVGWGGWGVFEDAEAR